MTAWRRGLCLGGLFVGIAIGAAPNRITADPVASPTPSATEIYYRALARLRGLPQGPYVEYAMRFVNMRIDGSMRDAADERVRERRSDRASWSLITAADDDHSFWKGHVWIGQHYLIPDAFLPLSSAEPPEASGSLPGLDGGPDLPLIATVRAVASPSYVVTLIGWMQLDACGYAAHLGLRPVRDPNRYNVREMWVRANDYVLCKATYSSYLYRPAYALWPPGSEVVTATLDERGLITSWSSEITISHPEIYLLEHGQGKFLNVAWSDEEPNYYFDQRLWDAHPTIPSPTTSPP